MVEYRASFLNFSKGVLSRRLLARTDVAAYSAGLLQGDNILVYKHGGFGIRPGLRYVSEVIDDGERLFPFTFSNSQTYALAFGQGYMQPVSRGGVVVGTEQAILGATQANPVVLTMPFHGFVVGQRLAIGGVAGMDELNERVWEVVSVPDDDHVAIDADGTGFGAFTGATGGTTNVAPPPAPPPAPPVPTPTPDPTPPDTTGGGGGGDYFCVSIDTPILLPDGTEVVAGSLSIGQRVRSQHEHTLEWGDWLLTGVQFVADQEVYLIKRGGRSFKATAAHRFWDDGGWKFAGKEGRHAGRATVARLTVAEAHTYVSAGVLSHNIKPYEYIP